MAEENGASTASSQDLIVAPDKEAAQELVTKSAEVVQLLALGSDLGIDSVIFELDHDPAWETAVTWVSMLSSIANLSSWGIGDILYFMRHRWNHFTREIFDLDDGKLPVELYDFAFRAYAVDLREMLADPDNEIVEFIGWTAYVFPKFWLLVGFGEVRVWEKDHKDTPTADEWETAISEGFTPFINEINDKTAWALYAAAVAWPRSKRRDHVHFTAHLELRHMFAATLPAELKGDERHREAGRLADEQMALWEDEGQKITTNFVRTEKKKAIVKRRGYEWGFPPPPCLTVRQTGDLDEVDPTWYCAIRIVKDRSLFELLAFHMGLTKKVPEKSYRVVIRNDALINRDTGEIVGYLDNTDKPAVDQALTALFKKLRWDVEDD